MPARLPPPKRVALLAVVSLLVAALGTLMPAPAIASYYESGVSLSMDIVRDSIPYRLNVKAIETMGFTHRLQVSIARLEDPSGVTRLRQEQRWEFGLEEGEFSRDGDTYRIKTGSADGALHVDLVVAPGDGACSDRQPLFVTQPEDGAFRIETGNETFGTITELPPCGKPWDFASDTLPGPPPCPVAGLRLLSPVVDVKERRHSDKARIRIFEARERVVAGEAVDWSVVVRGVLPGDRFGLDRHLRGRLRPGGAPWLSGSARIRPASPLDRGDWYDCKGRRETRSVQRSVTIDGDLTLDVIGFESYSVMSDDAVVLRSWVRARR